MNSPVVVSNLGACGLRLTLNRPDQANAVDDTLCNVLLSALQEAAEIGARLVVLDANGKNFCGGFDFTGVDDLSEGDLLLRFVRIEQMLQLLWRAPFVTIACSHGAVFGAGADLVAASTYRIGAPGCRFRFPGYRFGIALGTRRLGCLLGEQKAREILLANSTLAGVEAREVGLLTHLEERESWDSIITTVRTSIEDLSSSAMSDLLANIRQDQIADDRDLASLARSAAQPGIHGRIAVYRAAAAESRKN
ncbi:enoyl-CoA hydratase/isomerase family protein [Methylobacterium longum]|uniref:Enoyl-CoA hydratase/isomerase family protein n=1 Tax=Methylobacterium longum TaxID=767694 RepID=A0ABT8AJS2_9HYPH|nr:enoyl-CoA hydratase/isomerase family protein [Methylobacterium longum]MDN3569920.1 enoyl-CoA hydratase/isomerase family protein [Methylobacterium longum]GJE14302.1 1,4-dihydroxy-2-naphthoyl-CoA synthase [Methylobacterium longum]